MRCEGSVCAADATLQVKVCRRHPVPGEVVSM